MPAWKYSDDIDLAVIARILRNLNLMNRWLAPKSVLHAKSWGLTKVDDTCSAKSWYLRQ